MTAWTLLFLASVLLDTPGLPFSGCNEPAQCGPYDGESIGQNLIQEDLQDALLTKSQGMFITCGPCKRIMEKLLTLVGDQLDENTITQAASQVCSRMLLLKRPCSYIMKKFLRRISQDIIEGKSARDICVDLKMCRPKAGE
ncbi:PREDICTED: granulysin [Condylura cristata]|uniref:granulysin n=1 Tax=Condylura cristata TaxID=143302 RepID=UPI00064348DC|nr:PREDICTED: granulysin [Condylura cristata]